ncbi:hypothetical protein ACFQ3N_04650 [Virgibacillus byunsanensis]|uniref:Uncharacterized protein n=1 Tax=Virgibacillus byunsanensis TaxID=570945 RepID=A0ABW3LK86_9BACI
MHSYVLAETTDGTQVDGIITGLDDENVYLAVPTDQYEQQQMQPYPGQNYQRQFGYGFGGYGYPGYGYGRPHRFRRLILPLVALTALSALPWY